MPLLSSNVSQGDPATADHYNNLRTDATTHKHDGVDTPAVRMNNGIYLLGLDSGAVARNVVGVNGSNQVVLGWSGMAAGTLEMGYVKFDPAAAKIVGGATSLSLRNNADAADNLILTDAGLATFRNTLTVSAGGVAVTAGGVAVGSNTGSSTDGVVTTNAAAASAKGVKMQDAGVNVGGLQTASATTFLDYTGALTFRNPYGSTIRATIDANGQLALPTQGTTGGLLIGTDATVYRAAALALQSNSRFVLSGAWGVAYGLHIQNTTSTAVSGLAAYRNDAGGYVVMQAFPTGYVGNGSFGLAGANTHEIVASGGSLLVGTYSNNNVYLCANGSYHARLNSTGTFDFLTATVSQTLSYNGASGYVVTNSDTGASAAARVGAVAQTASIYLYALSAAYSAPYTNKALIQGSATAGLMIQNVANGPIQFYTNATTFAGGWNADGSLGVYANAASVATVGTIRLPNLGTIYGRNAGGTADLMIAGIDSNDYVYLGVAAAAGTGGRVQCTTSAPGGQVGLWAGGNQRLYVHSDGSIVVGAPTGANKGAGTINAQAVYDDNTLLTDYVFEPEYALMPIADMRAFYEANLHLPTIPGREVWERDGSFSLGKLASHLWETVEVQARYIAELHDRVAALEAR